MTSSPTKSLSELKSTCSPELAASPSPPDLPACPTTSISGPVASPARTSPTQEKEQVCLVPDQACFLRLFGYCVASDNDRLGCSLRTYLRSRSEELTGYCLNWKVSATPAGRPWWELELLGVLRTDYDYFWWSTPRVVERGLCIRTAQKTQKFLGQEEVTEVDDYHGNLEELIAMFPGPHAQEKPNLTSNLRGTANVYWIASLMGYPSDWCDVLTKTL